MFSEAKLYWGKIVLTQKMKFLQDNPGIMVRALNQLFRAMEESTESFYKVCCPVHFD